MVAGGTRRRDAAARDRGRQWRTAWSAATVLGIDRSAALSHDPHPPESQAGRLLGDSGWQAKGLGLDERFLRRAIAAVGNQAELYRRDLGDASPLKLPVGPNAPLEQGGALLSIPVSVSR